MDEVILPVHPRLCFASICTQAPLAAERKGLDETPTIQIPRHGSEDDGFPSVSTNKRTKKTEAEADDELELRILIKKEYTPIHQIKDPTIFWDVFTQCVICSHTLYSKGGILHRDITINNLAYYLDEDKKPIGVIMDFDLAGIGQAKPSSRVRSGTAPFMARDLLNPKNKSYTHQFHHELESFVYVLIWYTLGYRGRFIPSDDPLAKFRRGRPKGMFSAKRAFFFAEWKELFPQAECKPDNDLLRFFCRRLSSYYFGVSMSQEWVGKRAEIEEGAEKARKIDGRDEDTETSEVNILPSNTVDPRFRKINFGFWLAYVGKYRKGLVCNKGCCVP